MKNKLLYAFPLLLAALSACNKDLSPLNTASTSFAPSVPCPVPTDLHLWSHVETNPMIGSHLWGGHGIYLTSFNWGTGVANTGCHSWKIQYGAVPSTSYGHWFGYSFYAPAPPPAVPFGQANFEMSFLINQDLTATLYLDEGTAHGGNGEEWSTVIHLTSSPSWQTLSIPLSAFSGGVSVDTQDIMQIWFQNQVPYPTTNLYIDDIKFN